MRKAKIIVAIIALVTLSGFAYLAINSGITAQKLQLKTIKLESTEAKLKDVNLQVEQLKTQSSTDKAKQEQLEKEKADLEKQVQAKADAKAQLDLAAANASHALSATASAKAVPSLPAGSHEDWLAQAGIAASDYGYVDYIVMREGSYRPCVVNGGAINCNYAIPVSRGGEGGQRAYGVCQALPGSKMASAGEDWATNPITQLKWCNGYAVGRYGSWANAYNFWLSHNWW